MGDITRLALSGSRSDLHVPGGRGRREPVKGEGDYVAQKLRTVRLRRGPGLDAPGVLYHVRVPGLERGAILREHHDRADFVACLAAFSKSSVLRLYH